MKDIFITGTNCAGKSWTAKRLAAHLEMSYYETDNVIIPLIDKYQKPVNYPEYLTEPAKQDIANGFNDLLADKPPGVINGFMLNYRDIRAVVKGITKRDYLLFNIMPSYDRWKRLFDFRTKEYPEITNKELNAWWFYIGGVGRFEAPDDFYYTVEDGRSLICSTETYQRPELAELKFKGLGLEGVSGRVLDLGCAEGYMGQFLLKQGVSEVVGIDNSWFFLEQAREKGNRVVLGDLNAIVLSDFEKFDYTLCLSVLHRVMEKEHLIAQIAAATRKEAIFELPVNLRDGLVCERYDSIPGHTKSETQAWTPSQEILELWFKKYFASFKLVGLSPLKYGDLSKRVVYKCQTNT